jgi:hypothetical protein
MNQRHDAWPIERRNRLIALASAGWTASEVGIQLGLSRSSVLGYAHRNGIKFPMTARKAAMVGRYPRRAREPKPPREPNFQKFGPDHPARKSRPFGQRAFSDDQIAIAIAARLAGASLPKAARLIGAGQQILSKWVGIPELAEAGRALFERARADAAERAAKARELAAFEAETARSTRERINWPILGRMSEKHRDIMERRIAGQTLQEIGDAYGITRERVRQIEVKWRMQGLVVPGARPLSEASLKMFPDRSPRALRPERTIAWNVPRTRKHYEISDAERERRADHMRRVSRAYWDARA